MLTIHNFPRMTDSMNCFQWTSQWLNRSHKLIEMFLQEKQIDSKHNFFFFVPVESANKASQAVIRFILIDCSWWISWNGGSFWDIHGPHASCDFLTLAWGREKKRKKRRIGAQPLYTLLMLPQALLCEETQITTAFFLQKRGLIPNVLPHTDFNVSLQFQPQLLVRLHCHVKPWGSSTLVRLGWATELSCYQL